MLDNVEVIHHSSIKINNIFIDPFELKEDYDNADYIFITHSHYDHFSEEDILKIKDDNTIIVIPNDLKDSVLKLGFKENKIIIVEPNKEYNIDGIIFETITAYNINKAFHPKVNNWVGYIITVNDIRYYIAGDTDDTLEARSVNCDVAFVPVGGTFTMTYEEAASLVNEIKPVIAIPIHYGSIVGSDSDAANFVNLLDNKIEGKILMKY